jgi:hypothetical protein
MADLVRIAGPTFIERSRQWMTWQHQKVLLAIARCRTAALGGHRDQCSRCGHSAISYNSCRNRHCPKCQGNARHRWLEARQRELLLTSYVHVVFTLPHELAPLALQNKKLIYNLRLRISAETLLEIASDPRHLGAEIGFFSVLHTWDQRLQLHPHVHCVLPAGGLSSDHTRWIQPRYSFFLPVKVLSRVFRGKFVAALKRACAEGKLRFFGDLKLLAQPKIFSAWLRQLFRHDWVVYCKPPFGGPEHALRYLGAYTHHVAISNPRLVSFVDGQVTFRWRDSAHHNKKRLMTLPLEELLRRFLLHSTCSRAALFAFATSAFWPTAGAPYYCHSVLRPWTRRTNPTPLHRLLHARYVLLLSGSAPSAADRCASSRGLLRSRSNSALHPFRASMPHESTAPTSTHLRASTRA